MTNKIAGKIDSEEVVLKIGTEGGTLSIQRFRAPGGIWKFIFITDESTMSDFLEEDDQIDLVKKYPPVDTFKEAIQLMNNYPWHEMHVVTIHQDYIEAVQSEKQKKRNIEKE
jgi:hypothetical protein